MAAAIRTRRRIEPTPLGDRRIAVSLFASIAVIYALTIPATRSEAEDAYWFATLVESEEWRSLPNFRHFLYLPLMRLMWYGVTTIDSTVRPFPVMVGAGIVMAAAAAGLFYLVARRLTTAGPLLAGAMAVGFALSRGSWRYAAEAEVYALAAIGVLLYLLAFARSNHQVTGPVVVLGALAVACNALSAIAVVAVPAVVALKENGWRAALRPTVAMTVTVLVTAGAMAAVLATDPEIGDEGLPAADYSPSNVPIGVALLGSDVVTVQPLFGFEAVRDAMGDRYADSQLDEELGFGESLAAWQAWVGLAGVTLAAGSVVALLFRFRRSAPWSGVDLALLAWLVAFVGVGAVFVADAPEPWILALVPLWLLFGSRLGAPALEAGGVWKHVVIGAVAVIVTHNLVGGALPEMDESRDLGIVRGTWLIENATPSELVITSNGLVFERYLTYQGLRIAEVRDALTVEDVDRLFEGLADEPERVLITGDLVEGDLGPHLRSDSEASARAREYVRDLDLELVHSDPALDIYRLELER